LPSIRQYKTLTRISESARELLSASSEECGSKRGERRPTKGGTAPEQANLGSLGLSRPRVSPLHPRSTNPDQSFRPPPILFRLALHRAPSEMLGGLDGDGLSVAMRARLGVDGNIELCAQLSRATSRPFSSVLIPPQMGGRGTQQIDLSTVVPPIPLWMGESAQSPVRLHPEAGRGFHVHLHFDAPLLASACGCERLKINISLPCAC
jgi:hypothetical protein